MTVLSVLALSFAGQVPSLVPRPQKVDWAPGYFALAPNMTVVRERAPRYLVECVCDATGLPLKERQGGKGVRLRLERGLAPEAYELTVDKSGIVISAASEGGLFNGIQTLRQLDQNNKVRFCHIQDAPRFPWRGLLLDDSRHFFPIAFIRKFIDEMAAYKLNTLHWHLTDDGGWRMQVRAFPELTEIGAWRKEQGVTWSYSDLWFPGKGSGQKLYGGYYTQTQLKDLVRYAATRNVTIVPEIEMPGHSEAATASHPDLQCECPPGVKEKYLKDANSQAPSMVCPGKDSTIEFYKKVLDETMEIFPSKFIHVGGDEVDKTLWHQCRFCQERMRANGLKNEEELQSWFIRQMDSYVASKGRRLIGWDEILEGGLAPSATVMSWRGISGGIAAAKAGHDVVMTPTSHCYFDYSYDTIPTEKVYSYEPIPAELKGAERSRVLGGQGNIWTEWIPTTERVETMAFPRALALSETLWTAPERKSWPDFQDRLNGQFGLLQKMKVAFRIGAPTLEPGVLNLSAGRTWKAAPAAVPGARLITSDGKVIRGNWIPARNGITLLYQLPDGRKSDPVVGRAVNLRPASRMTGTGLVRSWIPWTTKNTPEPKAFTDAKNDTVDAPTLKGLPDTPVGAMFTGGLYVRKEGRYTLGIGSDDGAVLYLDGQRIMDTDGAHPYLENALTIDLKPGVYKMQLCFFDGGGARRLEMFWTPPGGSRTKITDFRR